MLLLLLLPSASSVTKLLFCFLFVILLVGWLVGWLVLVVVVAVVVVVVVAVVVVVVVVVVYHFVFGLLVLSCCCFLIQVGWLLGLFIVVVAVVSFMGLARFFETRLFQLFFAAFLQRQQFGDRSILYMFFLFCICSSFLYFIIIIIFRFF